MLETLISKGSTTKRGRLCCSWRAAAPDLPSPSQRAADAESLISPLRGPGPSVTGENELLLRRLRDR